MTWVYLWIFVWSVVAVTTLLYRITRSAAVKERVRPFINTPASPPAVPPTKHELYAEALRTYQANLALIDIAPIDKDEKQAMRRREEDAFSVVMQQILEQ